MPRGRTRKKTTARRRRNSGPPDPNKRKLIYFQLSTRVVASLDHICEDHDRSRSWMLSRIVYDYLDNPVDDPKIDSDALRKKHKGDDLVTVFLRLFPKEIDSLDKLAEEDDRPRSAILRKLATEYVARHVE